MSDLDTEQNTRIPGPIYPLLYKLYYLICKYVCNLLYNRSDEICGAQKLHYLYKKKIHL